MKKINTLFICLFFFINGLYAHKKAVSVHTISFESGSINEVSLKVAIKANESLLLEEIIPTELPSGIFLGQIIIPSSPFVAGDSLVFSIPLLVNIEAVSFFAQDFSIDFLFSNSEGKYATHTQGKLYVTPWQTVETWSMYDYHNLNRIWITHDEQVDSTRLTYAKETVPQSDIPEEYSGVIYELPWSGLAYKIPATEEMYYNHIIRPEQAMSKARIQCTTFKGRVTGNYYSNYTNDLGITSRMPLTNIYVRLREKDRFNPDDQIAEAYTNNEGRFEINFNTCQPESEIELFLEFFARTPDGKVEALTSFTGGEFKHRVDLNSIKKSTADFHTIDKGAIQTNDDAFRVVHWMNQGRKFISEHLPFDANLDVVMYGGNSFYIPGKFLPGTRKIVLETGDEDKEGTPFHEFGHYYFDLLTDYSKIPFYNNADGTHRWTEENHPMAAFNEGWANAMEMMLDAYTFRYDNEYGYDKFYYEQSREPSYEEIDPELQFVLRNPSNLRFNNGMNSEYLIGKAIYDLWDGPDKGLPEVARFASTPTIENPVTEVVFPGYDDSQSWNFGQIDDVSFSLKDIASPLVVGSNQPASIYYYFYRLIQQQGGDITCNERRLAIEKIFRENWVVDDIAFLRRGNQRYLAYGATGNGATEITVTDESGFLLQVDNLGDNFLIPEDRIYRYNYFVYYDGTDDKTYIPENFKLAGNTGFISQSITLNSSHERPQLTFSSVTKSNPLEENPNFYVCSGNNLIAEIGNIKIEQAGVFYVGSGSSIRANTQDGLITVAEGSSLYIEEGALLSIGRQAGLIINGTVVLRAGASLRLRGNISFQDNGKLIIQDGAFVCIDDEEASFNFEKSVTNHLEFGRYILGFHPQWEPEFGTSSCERIGSILENTLGLTLTRTNEVSCNNTNFGYQITGPQLPGDAQICWSFPPTWSSWVSSQNCQPWLTNASGTVNNWQQGNYQGGEVVVIVKANGRIQELVDAVPSAQVPQLRLLSPQNFNGTLNLCDDNRLVVTATTGIAPYQFAWTNHWNLNHGLYSQATQSTLTLNPEQWVFDVQTLHVNATDSRGCVSNTVHLSVSPSVNTGWIARPLNYPLSANQKTLSSVGFINNDFALSKSDEHIYFTDNNNLLRYYTFSNTENKWILSPSLASGVAGSVELYEDNTEKAVFFKTQTGQLQLARYDKALRQWQAAQAYGAVTDVKSHVLVTSARNVFYRNTADQLISVSASGAKNVLATQVAGVNYLLVGNLLFYTSATGTINNIHLTTGAKQENLASNAKYETMLAADSKGNVYFVNNTGDIRMIPYNGTTHQPALSLVYKQAPSTAWRACNGYFNINKQSDVLYYTGDDGIIYQLYQLPTNEWKSVRSSFDYHRAKGYIEYRYPHAFYMSDENIYNLYYQGGEGCNVLQREGVTYEETHTTTWFNVYPNPGKDAFSIQLHTADFSGKLELTNNLGKVLETKEVNNYLIEWMLPELPSGMYIMILKDHEGQVVETQKVLITE